jgi:anti-sigma-K factor RskA
MSESEHHTAFESLGAYALGALPDGERAQIAAHLEHCPVCAEDAASLERAATRLIDVVPMTEPSPELRNRIMAIVEPEAALLRATAGPPQEVRVGVPARRASWLDALSLRWAAGAAALLILGGVIGATAYNGLGGTDTRTLSAEVGQGHAWIELGEDDRAHLVVNGLAAPRRNKVYELWIQSGDAAPRPASDNLSQAVFVVGSGRVEIPARLQEGDRVMVTEEPPGGSRIPTATPIVITSRV